MPEKVRRRDYLRWLGIGSAAMIAGCAGTGEDSTNPETDAGEIDGNLRIAEGEGPATMNPFLIDTFEGFVASRLTHSALTWTDSDFNIRPDLAIDWSSNEDADEWTFELREGVSFNHNGNEVLAEDVKASIDTIQDPDTGSPGIGSIGPIESTEIINDHAIQINTTEPFSQLPLTLSFGWVQIVEANAIEEHWDEMGSSSHFGSGPFELDEFNRGEEIRLTAADDFYFEDQDGNPLPLIDSVTQVIIPDSSARINAITQNEVDAIRRKNPREYEAVEDDDDIEVIQRAGGRTYPVVMNHNVEPWDDNRVRQAVKYAIDSEEIMAVANLGMGVVAETQSPIGPANTYYADGFEPDYGTTAKPEQAISLLEDAGYGDGIELDHDLFFAPGFAEQIGDTAVLVQEQLGEIGIEFDLQEVTWDTHVAEVDAQEDFYISTHPLWAIERQALFIMLHQEGTWSPLNWSDETYDEFTTELEAALATTDEQEMAEHYAAAQRVAHQNAGYAVPFFADALASYRSRVTSFELDPELQKIFTARGDNPITLE